MDTSKKIIDYFKLQDSSDEERQGFVKEIEELVQQVVMATILRKLKKEKRQQFLGLLNSKVQEDENKWLDFAKKEIKGLDRIIDKEVRNALQEVKLGI